MGLHTYIVYLHIFQIYIGLRYVIDKYNILRPTMEPTVYQEYNCIIMLYRGLAKSKTRRMGLIFAW